MQDPVQRIWYLLEEWERLTLEEEMFDEDEDEEEFDEDEDEFDEDDEGFIDFTEPLDELYDLYQQALKGEVFQPSDIPALLDLMAEIEKRFGDDLDWAIKDYVFEIIRVLAVEDGISKWADVLTKAIDHYSQMSSKYLDLVIQLIVQDALFESPTEKTKREFECRVQFLDAMKRNVGNYRDILIAYYEDYSKEENVYYPDDQSKERAQQIRRHIIAVLRGICEFIKERGDTITTFAECDALRD